MPASFERHAGKHAGLKGAVLSAMGLGTVLVFPTALVFMANLDAPYMDEVFHVPQVLCPDVLPLFVLASTLFSPEHRDDTSTSYADTTLLRRRLSIVGRKDHYAAGPVLRVTSFVAGT